MRATSCLLAALLPGLAGPALAASVPVTYTVNGAQISTLTATVDADLWVRANTNLGSIDGTAHASGSLQSDPTGSVTTTWGAPVGQGSLWNDRVEIAAGGVDIDAPQPGQASGTATLDLFGFIPLDFGLTVNVDNIGIGLASPVSVVPDPSESVPGDGPWTLTDGGADILLDAQVDFSATGLLGITFGAQDEMIGPSVVSGVPLAATLLRTGTTGPGDAGTGSAFQVDLSGLTISLPPQPVRNIETPGCEVAFCLLDVESVDVQLQSLTLSDITGTVFAESNAVIPAPEPGALALLGPGLAALALRRRRG